MTTFRSSEYHRRSASRRTAAIFGRVAALTAFATIAAGVVAQAADAAAGPYLTTASPSLNERSAPSTSSSIVGSLPYHTSIMIDCQTTGSSVNGSDIWDKLPNGAYVSDDYVNTPVYDGYSPGIPQCGRTGGGGGTVGQTVGDNPFPSGQCTYGADQLAHNYMASDPSVYPSGHTYIRVWGNADQWASSAAGYGWTVTSTPHVHSIVVFQPGVQGADWSYGHVAWVTAVYSNGTFQIEEMNGPAGPGRYDYRTVSDASGESFILIPPFS